VGATDWSLLHPDSSQCPEGSDIVASTASVNMMVTHSHPVNVSTDGLCRHNRRLLTCSLCLFVSGTPLTPPKKRHCRSLSIPGDGKCGRKWQPQASSIWRPVALRPHLTSSKGHKNRNSPLALHKRDKACSSSPLGGAVSGGHHHGNSSQSPGIGTWYVGGANSDCFSTPPESPVPRPASASSGFCDSSTGSLNVVGFDMSPMQGGRGGITGTSNGCYLKMRSFSMEEPISTTLCGARGGGGGWGGTGNAGSVPVVSSQNVQSTPSSPLRYHIPRCRSQPCELLHERKSGLKRRRDEERPALDFFKMKEVSFS
ncbi:Protein FAM53A, partial [Lamellibrachia satsuma]